MRNENSFRFKEIQKSDTAHPMAFVLRTSPCSRGRLLWRLSVRLHDDAPPNPAGCRCCCWCCCCIASRRRRVALESRVGRTGEAAAEPLLTRPLTGVPDREPGRLPLLPLLLLLLRAMGEGARALRTEACVDIM